MGVARVCFCFALLTIPHLHAMTCFETNQISGEIEEQSSDEFTYCGIASNDIDQEVAVFGLSSGAEETAAFDRTFELEASAGPWKYSVMTSCVLEKFENVRERSEGRLFRCVCNADRCNNATSFEEFFDKLN